MIQEGLVNKHDPDFGGGGGGTGGGGGGGGGAAIPEYKDEY